MANNNQKEQTSIGGMIWKIMTFPLRLPVMIVDWTIQLILEYI